MSVCEAVTRQPDADPDLGGLSGLELQHDLYLTLGNWTAWNEVSARLAGAGAELQSLQISRQNDVFAVRCRLKGLSSEAVRGLSGGLLDQGLAQGASVEHLMLSRVWQGQRP